MRHCIHKRLLQQSCWVQYQGLTTLYKLHTHWQDAWHQWCMIKNAARLLSESEIFALTRVNTSSASCNEALYSQKIVAVGLLGPLPRSDNPLQATYTLGRCQTSMMCGQKCSQVIVRIWNSRPDKSEYQCSILQWGIVFTKGCCSRLVGSITKVWQPFTSYIHTGQMPDINDLWINNAARSLSESEIFALTRVNTSAAYCTEALYSQKIVAVGLLGPFPRSDNPLQATYTLGRCQTSMMCDHTCSQIIVRIWHSRPDKSEYQCSILQWGIVFTKGCCSRLVGSITKVWQPFTSYIHTGQMPDINDVWSKMQPDYCQNLKFLPWQEWIPLQHLALLSGRELSDSDKNLTRLLTTHHWCLACSQCVHVACKGSDRPWWWTQQAYIQQSFVDTMPDIAMMLHWYSKMSGPEFKILSRIWLHSRSHWSLMSGILPVCMHLAMRVVRPW